jgi:hypothetical protein
LESRYLEGSQVSFCQSGKALSDKYRPCGRATIVLGYTTHKHLAVEVCTVCDKVKD